MSINWEFIAWIMLGVCCVVSAIGGSHISAWLALLVGLMAGKSLRDRIKEKAE